MLATKWTSLQIFRQYSTKNLSIESLRSQLAKINRPNYLQNLIKKNENIGKLKQASVLVPISIKTDIDSNGNKIERTYFTLTKRTDNMRSHKGDVCFVGGKRDPDDLNEAVTAYREAKEEINLDEKDTTLLAQMVPLITFDQVLVTPVIVHFDQANFKPVLNQDEVDLVFDLPTERFLSSSGYEMKHVKNKGGSYYIHYFKDQIKDREVVTWGFTAYLCTVISMILNSRSPEFQLAPNIKFTENDVNSFLEKWLLNKLAVSNAHRKDKK